MMAKAKTVFFCNECGAESPKWSGQCAECGQWNVMVEQRQESSDKKTRHLGFSNKSTVVSLKDVDVRQVDRIHTFSTEFDRVLGGGLVPGSVVLIGGDPGIGKSTLLLQALSHLDAQAQLPCLYVSGEESSEQIALRAKRLGLASDNLRVMADNHLELILETGHKEQPKVMVADSIQTFFSDALTAAPGSVSQVRESASRLVRYAKQTGCCVILVGHVTKEGALAGPKILEHMVDTVLYFEGDNEQSFRLIRAIKNRFGAVNEIGVFAMTEEGLKEVANPSAMFVNRKGAERPGSVVFATQEGSRPMLVEVQALVDDSGLNNARRLSVGLEQSRLAMLLAICHRHAGISLAGYDVYTNVVGGIKIHETASDLAVLLAILSSLKNKPLGADLVVFGEIGLSGELRPIQRGVDRLKEAQKLGFKRALIPQANAPKTPIEGMEIIALRRLDEALCVL